MTKPVLVYLEESPKKAFACALDWPGWSRSGRDAEAALEALVAYADRYRAVAEAAGERFPSGAIELEVVETVAGGSGTAFGVPSVIVEADRVPVGQAEAKRLAGLVEAAWAAFDRTAATSPASLRKGPRGGGRDRDKMVRHVNEADSAYARETGAPVRLTDASDRSAVKAMREGMLEVLRRPSDGAPLDGGRWTQRFAARRVAWHALDHAWEMEDRSTPE